MFFNYLSCKVSKSNGFQVEVPAFTAFRRAGKVEVKRFPKTKRKEGQLQELIRSFPNLV